MKPLIYLGKYLYVSNAASLVESVYAIRQRLTPVSFVLWSFLLFIVTLSAKDLWRKGVRFHTGAALENMVYFAMKLSLIDEYTHYNSQIELEGKKLIIVVD